MTTPRTPKPVPTFRWEELDAAREAARNRVVRTTPAGFTIREYAEQYGLTLAQARSKVRWLIATGVVQRIGTARRYRPGSNAAEGIYDIVRPKETKR